MKMWAWSYQGEYVFEYYSMTSSHEGEVGLFWTVETFLETTASYFLRQLLTEASTHMQTQQDSVAKAVSHYLLDIVQPRVISFEDQVFFLKIKWR